MVHWADVTAHRIIHQKGDKDIYTIAAGITPSGVVHIGNFREIMTNELVKRALEYRGKKVRFIYSWDDFDVFRKVPVDLPKQDILKASLRKPIVDVIDPRGLTDSYARGNEIPIEDVVHKLGIHPEFIYQHSQYRAGHYAEQIKFALEHTDEIKDILNVHREHPLTDDWLPISVFSTGTGTDEVSNLTWDGEWGVSYTLKDGTTETQDFREGGNVKLKWRIDWPMRWKYENVDFEPGGKDHSTKGGSFDTGKEIVKLWDHEAPTYIMYDFVSLKGQSGKMSSSKGNVVTVQDVLKVYEPSIARFLFAGPRANAEFCISFDLDVIKIYEDFDKCERVYYGMETLKNEKDTIKNNRTYELSCVNEPSELIPYQPSFRHLTNILLVNELDIDKTISYLENELKNEHDKERLRTRATCAKYWLEHFAPEDFRYTVNTSAQPVPENMQDLFTELAEKLVSKEWTDDELHEEMYVLCTNHSVQHKDFFKEAYKLIISKEKGPRLAAFILQVGRERVARLFKPINTEKQSE